MVENNFDNAIMGCKGVFRIASPVLNHISNDPKSEILEPDVQGTLNVLRSCRKNPAQLRVVLASSSSVVRVKDGFDPNIPLDESSWSSLELCKKLKAWYPMSKIMVEKAAWEYCKENEIDLVTILPSFIIGPNFPSLENFGFFQRLLTFLIS